MLRHQLLLLRFKLSHWIGRARRKIIGRFATHVLIDSWNGKLLISSSDFSIGRKLSRNGEYDRNHVEKIRTLVSPQSRVLFVGSHVGALVIPVSKMAREVVAIEANPATFETLLMNLKLNDCRNVRALNLAASEQNGVLRFLMSEHNTGGSKIAPAQLRPEYVYDHPKCIEVQARRLDDVLPEFAPTHIVMDIEGGETSALAGMPRLLAACNCLIVEFLPSHIENIAGISCEEFLGLLPYDDIRLLDQPEEKDVVGRARSDFYFGGADLLCQRIASKTSAAAGTPADPLSQSDVPEPAR